MTATTITLLSERDAMERVGMRSVNRWVYAISGDRVREVVEWVDGQPMYMTMQVHWEDGEILAAYVMFVRAAHTDDRLLAVNSALTLFQLSWKQRDGFEWRGNSDLQRAIKAF